MENNNNREKDLDTFPISEIKPLQRFKRNSWKFHTFVFIKTENLTYHYRSELNGQKYETTNKDLLVTLIR